MEIAWLCDTDTAQLHLAATDHLHASITRSWRHLLDAELDGIILANDFDQHAPLAIEFLRRDVHVLSETAACIDATEASNLIAAERTSAATYSFAENYVTHPHVHAIVTAVGQGEIGDVELLQCEYLHGLAPNDVARLIDDPAHWRGRIAPTQYCTHTVSPILAIADAAPTEVAAWPVRRDARVRAVVLAIRLSNGALAIATHGFLQGEQGSHWSWVSARGQTGLIESIRSGGESAWDVRLQRDAWTTGGQPFEEIRRVPDLVVDNETIARHEEGSMRIALAFKATIQHRRPPAVPLRRAIEASLVGIHAAQSLASRSHVAIPAITA